MAVIANDGIIVVRHATLKDYDGVLAINNNIYDGTDYIPAMYKIIIHDHYIWPFVLEMENMVVGFLMGTVLNNGSTILLQAGRIKACYAGKGYHKRFENICIGDMLKHFPQLKESIRLSKVNLTDISRLPHEMSRSELIQIIPSITVQGSKTSITRPISRSSDEGNMMRLVLQSELQIMLTEARVYLRDYVTLKQQPYELTNDNIKYIVDEINPVCFLSKPCQGKANNDTNICGISFHNSVMSKVGLVIYMFYKGFDVEDFQRHLQFQLQYISERLLPGNQQIFHMYINFSICLRLGEVLQVAFQNGLSPGIREEGFVVITKNTDLAYKANL